MPILVSIIVPVYNSDKFIEECLDSIIQQDFHSFEILVSDDCSNDSTRIILEKYNSINSVRIFLQSENLGITGNCNFLINEAVGDYICFFAGDDIMLPGKLRKQYAFMEENKSFSFSYHPAEIFSSETNKVMLVTDQNKNKEVLDSHSVVEEMGVSASMSIMARRDMLPNGFFNQKFKYVSDWLIQIELATRGPVGFIGEPLCRYRKYGNNNGKDLSAYEHEFKDLLDYVKEKYPELALSADKGMARYLIGKFFRVVGGVKKRDVLVEYMTINKSKYILILYWCTYFPMSDFFFNFLYNNRYFLKKLI